MPDPPSADARRTTAREAVEPAEVHKIADTWRDCVVVCSCGWRGARKTMGKAKEEWLGHARSKH